MLHARNANFNILLCDTLMEEHREIALLGKVCWNANKRGCILVGNFFENALRQKFLETLC